MFSAVVPSVLVTLKIESFELPWRGDEDRFHAHCVTRTGLNSVVQNIGYKKLEVLRIFSCSSIGSCRFTL